MTAVTTTIATTNSTQHYCSISICSYYVLILNHFYNALISIHSRFTLTLLIT